jgi:hypothetical protein
MKFWAAVGVFSLVMGCASGRAGEGAEAPDDEGSATESPSAGGSAAPAPDCERFANPGDAEVDYEEGKTLLEECGEACMKSEGGGKKRAAGFEKLKSAAERGHFAAQALYGSALFGDLMTTGTEPELADDYIEAVYFLWLAARRGDQAARELFPDPEHLTVTEDGKLSQALEGPLTNIEEAWVIAGIERAQTDLPCFAE